MSFNYKFTYSDDWHRERCQFEKKILIEKPVFYRHVYSSDGELKGVIVDHETADDFHYELMAEDWKKFSDLYLQGDDEKQALREFFKANNYLFAFESALKRSGIKYKKIAFY